MGLFDLFESVGETALDVAEDVGREVGLPVAVTAGRVLSYPGTKGQDITAGIFERLGASESVVGAVRGRRASLIAQAAPFLLIPGAREFTLASIAGSVAGGEIGAAVGGEKGRLVGEIAGGLSPLAPGTARQVSRLATLPSRIRAGAKAGEVNLLLSQFDIAMDLQRVSKLGRMDPVARQLLSAEGQGIVGRLRGNVAKQVPHGEDDLSRLRDINKQLLVDKTGQSDIISNLRDGNVTAIMGELVPIDRELITSARVQLSEANRVERIVSRIPGIRSIWSGVDPSLNAKLLKDPVLRVKIEAETFTDQINTIGEVAQETLSRTQLRSGMLVDEATGELAKVAVKGGSKVPLGRNGKPLFEHVMQRPDMYELTAGQVDWVVANHTFLARMRGMARMILEDAEIPRDRVKEVLKFLGTAETDGGFFYPRLPKFWLEAGQLSDYSQPRLLQFMRKNLGVELFKTPKGFTILRPRVRGRIGAKQQTEFERQNALASDASRVIFEPDGGKVVEAYAAQIASIVRDEGIFLPAMQKMGVTMKDLAGPALLSEANKAKMTLDKIGNASTRVNTLIHNRSATQATLRQIKNVRESGHLTEEATATLGYVEHAMEDFLAVVPSTAKAGSQLTRRTESLAGATARVAGKTAPVRDEARIVGDRLGNVIILADEIRSQIAVGGKITGRLIKRARQVSQQVAKAKGRPVKGSVDLQRTVAQAQDAQADIASAMFFLMEEAKAGRDVLRVGNRLAKSIAKGEKVLSDDSAKALQSAQAFRGKVSELEQARRRLVEVAKGANKELGVHKAAARDQLDNVRLAIKETQNAKIAAQYSTIPDIPSLHGRYFSKEMAKHIRQTFGIGPEAGAAFREVAAWQAPIQTFISGLDFGVTFLQALAAMPANPVGWAKALSVGLMAPVPRLGPRLYAGRLAALAKNADPVTGRSWLNIVSRSGLRLGSTELYSSGKVLENLNRDEVGILGVLSRTVSNLPLNRAFVMQRNIAAIELLRSQVSLEQAILHRGLSLKELKSVARQVDLATGAVSLDKLGVSSTQSSKERLIGRFGVQWFRSQTGRLVQAANSGMDGEVARRLLFQQLGAMGALYVAGKIVLGQVPNFDPTSGKFMTIRIEGNDIGFGGIFHSTMRLVAETNEAIIEGDLDRFTEIKSGRNPLTNFWHNGAPTVGRMVGEYVLEINKESRFIQDRPTPAPIRFITPFSAEAFLESVQEGKGPESVLVGTAATALGLRQFPTTPLDLWREVVARKATELGYTKWDDVPKAAQRAALRNDPELGEANDLRADWLRQKGDNRDFVFKQNDQSRAAISDVMTGQWAKVQTGEVSKAEWRVVYSEFLTNHAYQSDNNFKGLELEDQEAVRREPSQLRDQMAILYQGIQPEIFDNDQDGIISDSEWDLWRQARDSFWTENPEAEQFRDYITVDFPASVWKDPIMVDAVIERQRAGRLFDEFKRIAKYTGLSRDEGAMVDQIIGLVNRARKEYKDEIARRGGPTNIDVPNNVAWGIARRRMKESNIQLPQKLLTFARLIQQNDQMRRFKLSPVRAQFLIDNPLMAEWYPGTLRDAGFTDTEAAKIGLIPAPLGTGFEEQLATIQGQV